MYAEDTPNENFNNKKRFSFRISLDYPGLKLLTLKSRVIPVIPRPETSYEFLNFLNITE